MIQTENEERILDVFIKFLLLFAVIKLLTVLEKLRNEKIYYLL